MPKGIPGRAYRLILAAAVCLFAGAALAADKPATLEIGVTTFLTGPASVFGIPARDAADIMIDDMNKAGGIGGVPVKLTYIDEGAGGEQLLSDYRRLVQSGFKVMLGSSPAATA